METFFAQLGLLAIRERQKKLLWWREKNQPITVIKNHAKLTAKKKNHTSKKKP
jgi:hypothetical protein